MHNHQGVEFFILKILVGLLALGIILFFVVCIIQLILEETDIIDKIKKARGVNLIKNHRDKFMEVYNKIGNQGIYTIEDYRGKEVHYLNREVNEIATSVYGLPPVSDFGMKHSWKEAEKDIPKFFVEDEDDDDDDD